MGLVGGGGGFGSENTPPSELRRVKNCKNWGKMLIFEGPTCKFPYEAAFWLVSRSGRTLRTFFPQAKSGIFLSEVAKNELCKKTKPEEGIFKLEAQYAENIRFARVFFAPFSKSKGSKTSKSEEKCYLSRIRHVNFHIKLHFLRIRRSGKTLRTFFPPAKSVIFRSEVAKKNFARKPKLCI